MASEIYKFDGSIGAWRGITEIAYQDGATLRDITEVHYNDNGVWQQVFGAAISPEVLAWSASSPSGTYEALNGEGQSFMRAEFDANGTFFFQPIDFFKFGSTGAPTVGTYRSGGGIDPINYEISINVENPTGTGGNIVIGGDTVLDGTFQPLNTLRGVAATNIDNFSTYSISVTVEIREIANPSNTTGAATFILLADGTPL